MIDGNRNDRNSAFITFDGNVSAALRQLISLLRKQPEFLLVVVAWKPDAKKKVQVGPSLLIGNTFDTTNTLICPSYILPSLEYLPDASQVPSSDEMSHNECFLFFIGANQTRTPKNSSNKSSD